MNKKIAIIGAGFAGLATACYLLKKNKQVTLFDHHGLGGGASGISAGLLHCYTGSHSKYNWKGYEGLNTSLSLIEEAQTQLTTPIIANQGILRVALKQTQHNEFKKSAERYLNVDYLTPNEVSKIFSPLVSKPGILIKDGYSIFPDQYLKGLWKCCEMMGVKFENVKIDSLSTLKDYNKIIVTAGAATTKIPELKHLPIRPVKGQILEIKWPNDLPALPLPINSQVYMVMSRDKKSVFAGSTFERHFTSSDPDVDKAKDKILPRIKSLIPGMNTFDIIDCKSGIRASTPNQKPIVKQVSPNCIVFAGLGSKGLLYHAYFAKEVANLIT